CPRKEWLQTLRRGMRAAEYNVQIHSEKELKGDSPAYAWLTALLVVLSQPRCGYEIAGLLRELFGISDHDLAVFSQGYGDRFQIETLTAGGDVVSKTLSLLAQLRLSPNPPSAGSLFNPGNPTVQNKPPEGAGRSSRLSQPAALRAQSGSI